MLKNPNLDTLAIRRKCGLKLLSSSLHKFAPKDTPPHCHKHTNRIYLTRLAVDAIYPRFIDINHATLLVSSYRLFSSAVITISPHKQQQGYRMRTIDLQANASQFVGAFDFDKTDTGITPRRLPAFTRLRVPEEMQRVIKTPAGVRIEFHSDTTEIQL